jgi:hypothetical protein
MRLFIAIVIVIAVVMLFQGAFRGAAGGPGRRSSAYGPSGAAF